jgi:hypothetical protein
MRRLPACYGLVAALPPALIGLASGFIMLLILRVMLGLGESVMYPASFN